MAVRLRAATDADVARITAIVDAAYARYVERIGRKPGPMTEDYSAVVRDKDVVVAERDGAVVGVAVLGETAEGFVLDNVAVHPDHHGTGAGRALLEHAEAAARRAGHDSLYLYTHELMTENQALYARIGYAEYERRDFGDAMLVFMRKPLARYA